METEMSGLRREVHRLAEAQKELAEAQKELAEAQTRTEARVEQLAEAQARTDRSVQELARQVGGLSEKLGGSLEDLALETVPAVLAEEWGLTEIDCGREVLEVDGRAEEVDLLLRGRRMDGRSVVILGEVKSRLTPREVEHHLARVERLRPVLTGHEVVVLFFGFQIGLEARRLVREAGAYFLYSNGRFLKIA
jgi:hypothetical protein